MPQHQIPLPAPTQQDEKCQCHHRLGTLPTLNEDEKYKTKNEEITGMADNDSPTSKWESRRILGMERNPENPAIGR